VSGFESEGVVIGQLTAEGNILNLCLNTIEYGNAKWFVCWRSVAEIGQERRGDS
jgi:hypothetical protein